MARVGVVLCLAAFIAVIQAVPQSVVLDETFTDLVELPSLKRSTDERKYKLKAFGKDIELDLIRNKDLLPINLPVYAYGEDGEGNPTVDDWTHSTDSFQSLYTDPSTGASVMIEDVEGETKMTGVIGEDLVIEPVSNINLPDDHEKREVETTLRHVIYKVKRETEENTADDYEDPSEEEVVEKTEKRALPERIFVPIQVVVDYALWKKLARSESAVIRYIKIFYNSVNELYSSMSWPSVSVSIHGITLCKSSSACSMVEGSRLGTDGLNAKTVLSAIQKYAYEQKSVIGTNYAAILVMTNYDLCSPQSSGTCQRSTSGYASVGTACAPYRYSKTSKTGIIEDHAAFDGIKTAAHEIGHLLGMKHDGDGPAASGAPGAYKCSWNDNYIMGQTKFVLNQFKWSQCSIDQLRWLAVQSKASCLLQKPSPPRYGLLNILPGKEANLDNQCKILYGSTSGVGCRFPGVNSGNDQLCLGLMCKVSSSRCSSRTAPAEGSYCGPQRFCKAGKCVCDPSAPKPTPPPRDPNCKSDNSRIRINGKTCVNLLTASDGLTKCDSNLVKQYCCVTRAKYCRATAISCGREPVTPRPTRPREVFTLAVTKPEPKYVPPTSANCGKPCADTRNMRINGKTCSSLLGTSSGKRSYCDNPTIITHCCQTRYRVCKGYHSITESCDSSCQDNPRMKINGKKCVQFLATVKDRENYCDASITKQHCCATKRKVCNSSVFGK